MRLGRSAAVNRLILREKLTEIRIYMNANCLKLNRDKTEFIVMNPGLPKSKRTNKDLEAEFDDEVIKQQSNARLLGCQINPTLNQDLYVQQMCDFIRKRICALKLISKQLTFKQRNMLAQGLVLSKISFCAAYWMMTTAANLNKVQILQNQCARLVAGVGIDYNRNKLFRELKWLNVTSLKYYFDQLQLMTVINYATPKSLKDVVYDEEQLRRREEAGAAVTRAMANGFIIGNSHNIPIKEMYKKSFIPRSVKVYKKLLEGKSHRWRHPDTRDERQVTKKVLKSALLNIQFTSIDLMDCKEIYRDEKILSLDNLENRVRNIPIIRN